MNPLGILLIAISCVIPWYWFSGMLSDWGFLPMLSQYFGIAALIVMAYVLLLATRIHVLEKIFGSLDRQYVLHKWLGIAALALILLHDNIDSDTGGEGGWLADFGESLGGTGLDGIQWLIILTLVLLIPYKIWRWTHKLIGIFYVCSVGHLLLIDKPFGNVDALALYTYFFCAIGVISYFYTVLPINRLVPAKAYKVSTIRREAGTTIVGVSPIAKGIKHRAGQFAFIQFDKAGLKEPHPFTISSSPNDQQHLEFSIKHLGDFTKRLDSELTVNTVVHVQGAFGHFLPKHKTTPQAWIAGGIGVTPFLAWTEQWQLSDADVHWFYCVKSKKDAVHLERIERMVAAKPNIHFQLVESTKARLQPQQVIESLNEAWPKVSIAFCGPNSMKKQWLQAFKANGLSVHKFRHEFFEIRTEIGVGTFIQKRLPKQSKRVINHVNSFFEMLRSKAR